MKNTAYDEDTICEYDKNFICCQYKFAADKVEMLNTNLPQLTLLKKKEIIKILKSRGFKIETTKRTDETQPKNNYGILKNISNELMVGYNKGLTDIELSKLHSVSTTTIQNWRKNNNNLKANLSTGKGGYKRKKRSVN